jgi:Lipopolysaccharide-assembly, LptC-related
MRLLLLSFAACILALGAAWAQTTADGGNTPQLPVGQIFKQFEYPIFQDGKLKTTLYAVQAKGITLNRAETTGLTIKSYENGAPTTTITSPLADLYVNEEKMRTKSTVEIDRADMNATSQECDFDLKTKQYILRSKVRVLLKHFNLGGTASGKTATATTGTAPVPAAPPSVPTTVPVPRPANADQSLLGTPGSYSDPNSSSPDTK